MNENKKNTEMKISKDMQETNVAKQNKELLVKET